MRSPPTSEAGAAIFSRGRSRGASPSRPGSRKGGAARRGPGAPLRGVRVGDPGGGSPALPAGSLAPGEGGGEPDKNPNRVHPAGERSPPPPRQAAASTCRGGSPPPLRSLPRRRKVFTPALECRRLTETPSPRASSFAPHSLHARQRPSPKATTEPLPESLPGARPPRLRPAAGGGRGGPGRLPSRPVLIAAHTPGEVAPKPLAAAPAEPTNLEEKGAGAGRGWGARRTPPARPPRRAHLSCQGPAAPPRLTHAGATVAQCLSKLLISPGAARRWRRRLGPAGEVELPGPQPRNTCCCRRRRGHTQAQRRPLPGHWLAPGSLTSASGRCRVSAANTRARARAHRGAPGYTRASTRPSPATPAR